MSADAAQGLPWSDAVLAAAILAVDPVGLGGVMLRSRAGPLRDEWLARLRARLPASTPVVRLPLSISDDRLLGGLDLGASLREGRPVLDRGVLATADRGVVVLAMAERATPALAARLGAVMDAGQVLLQRDGLADESAARFGLVALDEGAEPDERPPASLADRLAFPVDLDAAERDGEADDLPPGDLGLARLLYPGIEAGPADVEALTGLAHACGIDSLRAPQLALRAARAHAALEGRTGLEPVDLAVAARLVLVPRATRWPAPEDDAPPDTSEPPPPPEDKAEPPPDEDRGPQDLSQADQLVEAVAASLPAGLLAILAGGLAPRAAQQGRTGAKASGGRGRPVGSRAGTPRHGARLDLVATLRAAAPWQRLRRAALPAGHPGAQRRVLVRHDDLRIVRSQSRTSTLIVFAVDASGSQALHRLGEAKGAVELLLAECYARRDEVALVAFRGQGAEIVLPPTRSLVRARRGLSGLPGGGGTPLAAGLEAAAELAAGARRKGRAPVVVLLTDGRANVARDGSPGRPQATEDAMAAAGLLRAAGLPGLLIDTSPRPQPGAEALALAMAARYVPLPHADAASLSRAVRLAVPSD